MILYGLSFFIFVFCSFSLFFRSDVATWKKIAGAIIIFLASMKYVIYQIIGGAFFSPDLPRNLILVLETLYGAIFILFFLLLLWDLYLLGNWLLAKAGFPTPQKLPAGWIKTALVLLSLAGGIWGTWETLRLPTVKTRSVILPDLPCSLNGFRIVQLTDLHIGPLLKKNWLAGVVQKVNALEPDLILLTGDYVDGHVDKISQELEPLANLKTRYGIFAVTGNHEYYWNVTQWEDYVSSLGIKWLNNSHKTIEIANEPNPLIIAGIPDLAAVRFGYEAPDLEKALKDAPDGVKILLSHQPKTFIDNKNMISLQLSGHTHGGTMFFLQPLIAAFNNGFVAGVYEQDKSTLYVSPGTGIWNGFSCRIGVPAEITNFILHCSKNEVENSGND